MSKFTDKLRAAADSIDASDGVNWGDLKASAIGTTKAAGAAIGEASANDIGRAVKGTSLSIVEQARVAAAAVRDSKS